MNLTLETELHEAFSAYVARIPEDAGVRLRAIEYGPRTTRFSPRLTAGALGGAVATAGTVVSVIVLGSAQPAFAGWRAAPSAASAAQATTTDSACQAKLASTPGFAGASGWNAVTTDVRGPFTVVIFQDGSSDATCFIGPSFTILAQSSVGANSISVSGSVAQSGGRGGASSSIAIGSTESGDINHMTVAHLDSSSNGLYTLVEGQIQPGVSGVTLVRSDGSDVQASTGGGWFVAWWPGAQDVTSAEITTPSGVSNEPLNVHALIPPVDTGDAGCDATNGEATPASVVCSGGAGGGAGGAGGGAGAPSTATQGGS
jgi:hypothetical protein